MYSYVTKKVDSEQGFATLTLNRPDRLNSLNHDLLRSFAEELDVVATDDSIRAVIITGAGRAFCSGVDTDELHGGTGDGPHKAGEIGTENLRRGFKLAHEVILGIYKMEKPVIAAINGLAVGAGFDIACACDIRIASNSARFMAAYVHVGLFPGYGGTWFYPRIFGHSKAAELMYSGNFMEVEEAKSLGFLNNVVVDSELITTAEKMAQRVAAGPPIAIRLAKTMMRRGMSMDLETSLEMAAAAESITLSSEDHIEGMDALRQRRRPEFKGN
ncbi:MAG: enoyl-CoA hydratase [Chloroflexi bacterium]|nr:enoyl-CoA hydratase [Chloroflexota bacterium]|tara:strand:- start:962 stop:1777 length:816 start_codon:yes stop_codon:yes gene_type:complete